MNEGYESCCTLTKPACVRSSTGMGLKLVSFFPGNAGTSVPTHLAMILLFRPDTGEPLAVMDGSGTQAKAHLEALSRVRRFDEIRVWSRTPENARRFAAEHQVRAMPDAESAVRGADVIVTATSAREPILRGAWLKPGAHVNAVGAPRPTWRELDDEAMRAGAVVVDSREAVLKESGDVILSRAPIYAEVGEIFAGARPRPAPGTTVFKSVGIAVEDIAAAKLVYEAASR